MPVRRASLTDLPALLQMVEALYHDERIAFDADRVPAVLRELVADPRLGFILIAENDAEPLAYAAATYCYSLEFGGRFALLDELYTSPPARGRGLGTTLIQEVIAGCQADGIGSLRLEVDHGNASAQRLYQRLGFAAHSRHLMTKRL